MVLRESMNGRLEGISTDAVPPCPLDAKPYKQKNRTGYILIVSKLPSQEMSFKILCKLN